MSHDAFYSYPEQTQASALVRIADALETLAARKPAPRIVIVPVPGNYSPESSKQLAELLREALQEED